MYLFHICLTSLRLGALLLEALAPPRLPARRCLRSATATASRAGRNRGWRSLLSTRPRLAGAASPRSQCTQSRHAAARGRVDVQRTFFQNIFYYVLLLLLFYLYLLLLSYLYLFLIISYLYCISFLLLIRHHKLMSSFFSEAIPSQGATAELPAH